MAMTFFRLLRKLVKMKFLKLQNWFFLHNFLVKLGKSWLAEILFLELYFCLRNKNMPGKKI